MKNVTIKLFRLAAAASIALVSPLMAAASVSAATYDLLTERVSVGGTASAEDKGNGASIGNLQKYISEDGRYVVFESLATNLISSDTNAQADIFMFDRNTHTTIRVSEGGTSGSPVEGNAASQRPSISSDGRYVAYQSAATNLVIGDTNAKTDIFVFDRDTHTTTRVSEGGTSGSPVEGNDDSDHPVISANGRYVVFSSGSTNLVIGDTNATYDAFRFDRDTHTTIRVSEGGTSGSPTEADDHIDGASVSGDGRYIAYESLATNLAGTDTNGFEDIFVFDAQNHTTTRVSEGGTSGSPLQSDGDSFNPVISEDGSHVVYDSAATNLVTGDTNAKRDAFISNVSDHTTMRVSVGGTSGSPIEGNADSQRPQVSADNRYVVFDTLATNLVSGDTNAKSDIFLFDTDTHNLTKLSEGGTSSSPAQSDGNSYMASISASGSRVSYYSNATNIAGGDSNAAFDVFVAQTTLIEDVGPNNGDANGDGTADSAQPKVASFIHGGKSKYIAVEVANCSGITGYSASNESTTAPDANYSYPSGIASFTATGCSSGVTEPITVHFYGTFDLASLKLRKFNSSNNTYADVPGAVLTAVTIGGQSAVKAVYTVTDGGALDEDGTANGTIVDPVGLALAATTATDASSPNTGLKPQNTSAQIALVTIGIMTVGIALNAHRKNLSKK